jgi:hypothetical protein
MEVSHSNNRALSSKLPESQCCGIHRWSSTQERKSRNRPEYLPRSWSQVSYFMPLHFSSLLTLELAY